MYSRALGRFYYFFFFTESTIPLGMSHLHKRKTLQRRVFSAKKRIQNSHFLRNGITVYVSHEIFGLWFFSSNELSTSAPCHMIHILNKRFFLKARV
jgi:hypothetical protein